MIRRTPIPPAIRPNVVTLQLGYRNQLKKEGHVHHTAADDAELENKIEILNVAALWQSVCWDELQAVCKAKEHCHDTNL